MSRFAQRLFALALGGGLALTLAVFAYTSSASPAQFAIYSDLPAATCSRTGFAAPQVYQNGRFFLKLEQYWTEQVVIDITFPDGRIFTVPASQLLDGVIDLPVNSVATEGSNIAGEIGVNLTVPGSWPYGCYIFTGRGLTSGKAAQAAVVVVPGGGPAASPGLANFAVTLTGSNATTGTQGSSVDLNGHGFRAFETVSVWLTAPDGTVLDYPTGPPIVTDASGDFQGAFLFTGKNPVGRYEFTALGTTSGSRVITDFTLTSPPVAQTGWATFNVAFPADEQDPQRSFFEVQGTRFNPDELVAVWLTLPDGAVRELPIQQTDGVGDFFAVIYLDERLPIGFYQASAQGVSSNHLVITSFNVEQTGGTFPNPIQVPVITETNSSPQPPEPNVVEAPFEGSPPETLDPAEQGNPGPQLQLAP